MDVVQPRCAGMDISKRDVKVCIRTPGKRHNTFDKKIAVFGAFTAEIMRLREALVDAEVGLVVMEATGDYWKPFYYRLEGAPFEVMLVNARHAKNLPGRKTDVSDATWLAELGAHGLVRGSFVPPAPIRELRDLTRTRTTCTAERSREIQRLEKLLEDAGIKLSSVVTRLAGVSSRAILEAMVAGERDPQTLAGLARGRLRNKTDDLIAALDGSFTDRHAFLTATRLRHIDRLAETITSLSDRIDTVIGDNAKNIELLSTMPGVSKTVAEVIIAETGGDMTAFPTAAHLASWAGVCPGHHQSANRFKNAPPRPGNSHLKGALGIAAMAAARSNGTYLQARYRKLAARRGAMKAVVATEHFMITAIWHMLTAGVDYRDLGVDYQQQHSASRQRRQAVATLSKLGYQVNLTPAN